MYGAHRINLSSISPDADAALGKILVSSTTNWRCDLLPSSGPKLQAVTFHSISSMHILKNIAKDILCEQQKFNTKKNL